MAGFRAGKGWRARREPDPRDGQVPGERSPPPRRHPRDENSVVSPVRAAVNAPDRHGAIPVAGHAGSPTGAPTEAVTEAVTEVVTEVVTGWPTDAPNGAPTDAAVIQQSLAAPERFAAVFDRHVDEIYRYAARRLGRQAAADVASEFSLPRSATAAATTPAALTPGPGCTGSPPR